MLLNSIILVVLFLLIGLIGYYLVVGNVPEFIKKETKHVDDVYEVGQTKWTTRMVSLKDIKYNGMNYALGFWINVQNWNYKYGNEKHIMHVSSRIGKNIISNPTIELLPRNNMLKVSINYYPKHDEPTGKHPVKKVSYDIEIKTSKWFHFAISQNMNVIDIYIDGKLVKSNVIPGIPIELLSDKSIIYIGQNGGFLGKIKDIFIKNKSMNTDDVYFVYKNSTTL